MKKVLIASIAIATFMAIAYAAATKFTNVDVTGDLSVAGTSTLATVSPTVLVIPTVNVLTSTPTALGQIVKDSSYKVYIGTNTTGTNGWQKIGTQS